LFKVSSTLAAPTIISPADLHRRGGAAPSGLRSSTPTFALLAAQVEWYVGLIRIWFVWAVTGRNLDSEPVRQ
jgi:hypothetical protein